MLNDYDYYKILWCIKALFIEDATLFEIGPSHDIVTHPEQSDNPAQDHQHDTRQTYSKEEETAGDHSPRRPSTVSPLPVNINPNISHFE